MVHSTFVFFPVLISAVALLNISGQLASPSFSFGPIVRCVFLATPLGCVCALFARQFSSFCLGWWVRSHEGF